MALFTDNMEQIVAGKGGRKREGGGELKGHKQNQKNTRKK